MQFDHFDIAAFCRDYWQKKPLLIRNPWKAWANPLHPDEFAGLACEKYIESRLVVQAGEGWQVEHGPFAETRFGKLDDKPWTLLIQAVDHHVPDVAALLEPFRFVPNWRIDDVMVSYATDGGGVGPHFDQYDVFLVQGLGRRRWQVGAACDAATALLPHDELRLLARFEAADEWILEPGDILYLPPRVAHNGIAIGDDCMTYSIGFRAPARSELIAYWCDHVLAEIRDEDRYEDPDLAVQGNAGEISARALDRLYAMMSERMLDRDSFARWFGQHTSMPKYPEMDWAPHELVTMAELRDRVASGALLSRNPASRFSFIRQEAGKVLLFVDGQCFECAGTAAAFAERICLEERLEIAPEQEESAETMGLIEALCNQGSTAFD